MSNLEKKGGEEEIFNKELASHLKEFKKLKTELEKLQNELIKGSSKELLAKFQTLERKLNQLKETIEKWGKENESIVLKRLNEELMRARRPMVRVLIQEIIKMYEDEPETTKWLENVLHDDLFSLYEIRGFRGLYMRRLTDIDYTSRYKPEAMGDTHFYDQGLSRPDFSVENLCVVNNLKDQPAIMSYRKWEETNNVPGSFGKFNSFADYYYDVFRKEFYLAGIDALLFMLSDFIFVETMVTRTWSNLNLSGMSLGDEINFIFPGCAILNFNNKFYFPALKHDVVTGSTKFTIFQVDGTARPQDFFVLFKK